MNHHLVKALIIGASAAAAQYAKRKNSPSGQTTTPDPNKKLNTAANGLPQRAIEFDPSVWQIEGRILKKYLPSYAQGRIRIPDGVTHIMPDTFRNVSSDGGFSVYLPASVTFLGATKEEVAFSRCSRLKSIEVSENNTVFAAFDGALYTKDMKTLVRAPLFRSELKISAACTRIGRYAFSMPENTKLTPDIFMSLQIPDSVREIDEYAFSYCLPLKKIKFPYYLNFIKSRAFSHCHNLEEIEGSISAAAIEENAFEYCTALKKFILSDKVKELGYGALSYCSSLKTARLSASMNYIRGSTFDSCKVLAEIDIPDKGQGLCVEGGAFSGCDALKNITFPQGLKSLGDSVFWSCDGLKSINIPKNCSLKPATFRYCLGIDNIDLDTENENLVKQDGIIYSKDKSLIYYAERNITEAFLPDSVSNIPAYLFRDCKNLNSVRFPEVDELVFDRNVLDNTKVKDILITSDKVVFANNGTFCDINADRLRVDADIIDICEHSFYSIDCGVMEFNCRELVLGPNIFENVHIKDRLVINARTLTLSEEEFEDPIDTEYKDFLRLNYSELKDFYINGIHFHSDNTFPMIKISHIMDVLHEKISPDMPREMQVFIAAALYAKYGVRMIKARNIALNKRNILLPVIIKDNNAALLEFLLKDGWFVTKDNVDSLIDLAVAENCSECYIMLTQHKHEVLEDSSDGFERFVL